MKVFLDASVLLAASGSERGASFWIIANASLLSIEVISSSFALEEVQRNLPKLSPDARDRFDRLSHRITRVDDVLTTPQAVVFSPAKDRPILLTAFANADVLLTLDRQDFGDQLGTSFYSLRIQTPAEFIRELRDLPR